MPRTPRSAVALLAVACSLLLGGPAHAQPSPPPTAPPAPAAPETNSWSLAPGGDQPGQPGSRPNLSYSLDPGTHLDDRVTLSNYSNVQLTFRVYATDAFTTPTGGFDLLRGDQPPVDAGSWIKVAQEFVTVPAATSLELPITIDVPADATPGDHAGGVVASSTATGGDGAGRTVALDRRAGTRLFVRVAGPIQPAYVIDEVDSEYHGHPGPWSGGELDVTYRVHNTGNVRLSANQVLAVTAPFGVTLAEQRPADTPELLPGATITLSAHLDGIPPVGLVSSDVSVTPFSATAALSPEPEPMTRSSRAWAVPWTLVALLVLALVSWRLVRRRRHHRAPAAGGGPTTDDELEVDLDDLDDGDHVSLDELAGLAGGADAPR